MARKLGAVQRDCLKILAREDHRILGLTSGSWHIDCGWIWDTASRTERVMESLAERGLVDVKTEITRTWTRKTYTINDAGREEAAKE